jgi:hypothetical protein
VFMLWSARYSYPLKMSSRQSTQSVGGPSEVRSAKGLRLPRSEPALRDGHVEHVDAVVLGARAAVDHGPRLARLAVDRVVARDHAFDGRVEVHDGRRNGRRARGRGVAVVPIRQGDVKSQLLDLAEAVGTDRPVFTADDGRDRQKRRDEKRKNDAARRHRKNDAARRHRPSNPRPASRRGTRARAWRGSFSRIVSNAFEKTRRVERGKNGARSRATQLGRPAEVRRDRDVSRPPRARMPRREEGRGFEGRRVERGAARAERNPGRSPKIFDAQVKDNHHVKTNFTASLCSLSPRCKSSKDLPRVRATRSARAPGGARAMSVPSDADLARDARGTLARLASLASRSPRMPLRSLTPSSPPPPPPPLPLPDRARRSQSSWWAPAASGASSSRRSS